MTLTAYFDGMGRQVYSIIGCGGKTSLVWALAQSNRGKKVLVTTTTHIQNPLSASGKYDFLVTDKTLPAKARAIKNGITFAGHLDTQGHFSSLPLDALEKIIPFFDYVYIEADGSRSRPLKAWEDYEPVITKSTTVTIGILPLTTIETTVSNATVHRLSLFTQLTGAHEKDTITPGHIYSVITGHNLYNDQKHKGLFDAAIGKKILLFNQSDLNETIYNTYAKNIISLINYYQKNSFYDILTGSIINNTISIMEKDLNACELNISAVALYGADEAHEAIKLFQRALAADAENPFIYFNLGVAQQKIGEYDEALSNFECALKFNYEFSEAWACIGLIYYEKGEFEKAENAYLCALKDRPDSPQTLNNLGVLYFKRKLYKEAAEYFKKSVTLAPEYIDALINLRDTYGELKNHSGEAEVQQILDRLQKQPAKINNS